MPVIGILPHFTQKVLAYQIMYLANFSVPPADSVPYQFPALFDSPLHILFFPPFSSDSPLALLLFYLKFSDSPLVYYFQYIYHTLSIPHQSFY